MKFKLDRKQMDAFIEAFFNVPQIMQGMDNWVLYSTYDDPKKDDPNHKGKYPINPHTMGGGSSINPGTWVGFGKAIEKLKATIKEPYRIKQKDIESDIRGLGFELKESGIACIDIDNCYDDIVRYQSGDSKSLLGRVLDSTKGSAYAEISQSGRGVHIFASAKLPGRGRKDTKTGFEMYDTDRFIAMTGVVMDKDHNDICGDCTDVFAAFYNEVFGEKEKSTPTAGAAVNPPIVCGVDIQEAIKAATATNPKFPALYYRGDISRYGSQSEADQALCNILCYYLQGDAAKIDTAFRLSGLMRDKWDRKTGNTTYGQKTINKAIEGVTEYFDYNRAKRGFEEISFEGVICYEGNSNDETAESPAPNQTDTAPATVQSAAAITGDMPTQKPIQDAQQQTERDVSARSAADIDLQHAKEPHFYIDGLLSEGVTFLNAFPKTGKSRLAMQIALALAEGKDFCGRECEKVGVLYLALEDAAVDFESRLKQFTGGNRAPQNFYYLLGEDFNFKSPTLTEGGNGELIKCIEKELKEHTDIKAVIIDVFGAIRSNRLQGEDFTNCERRDITTLIRCAEKHGVAFIVIHHISKKGTTESFSSSGSGAGSYVVAGTVQAEWKLERLPTESDKKQLILTCGGRRCPEKSFALLDKYPGFDYQGDAKDIIRDVKMEDARSKPLYQVCVAIANDKGDWKGHAEEIKTYASDHHLPDLDAVTYRSFNKDMQRALKASGVGYDYSKNGTGGGTHRLYRLDKELDFDAVIQ